MHNSICPQCNNDFACEGQRFTHKLTPGLVVILIKMARESKAIGLGPFRIQIDGGFLQGSEIGNYQKLRYFNGLIIRGTDERDNIVRGKWLVTRQGFGFLRGEYKVPKSVITVGGKVIEKSPELVGVQDYKRKFREQWQLDFIEDLQKDSPRAQKAKRQGGLFSFSTESETSGAYNEPN